MSKTIVSTKRAPAAIGSYSQAVVNDGMVYTSGQIGIDPATGKLAGNDIESQTGQVMKNLEEVLRGGGANFDGVIKTTIYLANIADFPKVDAIYKEHFEGEFPARATIQAGALPLGALVEIDMIAVATGDATYW